MKEKIIHYFNQSAATYDAAAEVQVYVAKRLASYLKEYSAEKILEIGCGTGLFSQHLCSLFPNASLLLTDIAPAMLQICRERFAHQPHIETACLDGETLAIPASFDLITSSMTLHWVEDIKQCFKKMVDKLSPGGSLVFAMLGENSLQEWRMMCEKFHVPAATQLFPAHQWLKHYFPELSIEVELFEQPYASAYAFLNSLKCLGARAAYADHVPISSGRLRKLLRYYADEVHMTYEIIYGRYTKA